MEIFIRIENEIQSNKGKHLLMYHMTAKMIVVVGWFQAVALNDVKKVIFK